MPPQLPKIMTPTKPKILLPAPFDWCYIPEGQVTLTDVKGYLTVPTTFEVNAFWMAKYPITNKQFGEFVKDGGVISHYWNDKKWNEDDFPVMGVTWHTAMAFCNWLGKKIGAIVSLPTEQEWQRVAQGDDRREYPWGNGFDKNRCNTKESGIGKTTLVTQYPNGASLFGVMDMAGNVWHWCLTDYNNGSNDGKAGESHIVRGGSWDFSMDFARASSRHFYDPNLGYGSIGFFVVCHP